jgi:hypothetical protein
MTVARGAPFDDLFAALTERMAVRHSAYPDTEPTQRDRVEWRNAGFSFAKRGYRRQGEAFVGFLAVRYDVSLYGATEMEALQRVVELVGALDYLVGPPQGAPSAGDGYDVGTSSKPVHGGVGDAAGYGGSIAVTLYLPVYREINGAVTVGSVRISVTALSSTTDVPSGDPLNPILEAG